MVDVGRWNHRVRPLMMKVVMEGCDELEVSQDWSWRRRSEQKVEADEQVSM